MLTLRWLRCIGGAHVFLLHHFPPPPATMLFSVICFVDLGPDQSNLLATALERVGITTAVLRKPAAGAVVLCRFSAAAGLETLYTPAHPRSLDLRSWVLAARAAPATRAQHEGSPDGAFKALPALDALLSADASWLSGVEECMEGGGMVSCTLLCAAPTSPVDQAALEAALKAADERFWAVNFAVVAPTAPAELGTREDRDAWLASLESVVVASDNGGYRAVPCTPAAAEELAFALLIPKEPALQATLSFPAALSADGKCLVRLALRPTILPLRDGVELVRLCNCHGRPLLNSATALCDCPFVKARGEYTCSISGKTLKHAGDIHPNAIAVGNGVLQLPSFVSLPWLGGEVKDGGTGADFSALACVTLASVSESQLFGAPFTAHAVEDEEEPSPTAASNAALVEALRVTLHRRDCGLLLTGTVSLDTGAHAMFRCLYLALPSAEPSGGLMLKRIASREEVLPASLARATEAPPALAQEVARTLTAMLPDTHFDLWSHERGMHQLLTQAIDLSLAPPPRGAMHVAEAEAMEARERASRGRKSSKPMK